MLSVITIYTEKLEGILDRENLTTVYQKCSLIKVDICDNVAVYEIGS